MNNLCRMRHHNQIKSHQRRMQTVLWARSELDSVRNFISAWRMFFISLLVSASKYILLIMNCTAGVWNMKCIPSCNRTCIGCQCCWFSCLFVWVFWMKYCCWGIEFRSKRIWKKDSCLSILIHRYNPDTRQINLMQKTTDYHMSRFNRFNRSFQ